MKPRSWPTALSALEGSEMAKSMLIVSRQAPWSGPGPREALDIALAGGAFDLPLAMLFLDDGALQLLPSQQPAHLQQKNLGANLHALPMFGVDELFVCSTSLKERGLENAELALDVDRLDAEGITALIDRFDLVVTL
jgi:tRNA 2-thiouridine synthesizing protein C